MSLNRILTFALCLTLALPGGMAFAHNGSCELDLAAGRSNALAEQLIRNVTDDVENEKLTIEVMHQVVQRKKLNDDTIAGWLRSIHRSQEQHPLNLLEYSALLFIGKSGIFDNYADPEIKTQLAAGIATAEKNMTPEKIGTSSFRGRLFYDAVIRESEEPPQKNWLQKTVGAVRRNINIVSVVTTLVGAALLSFEPGRYIFAGGLIGLAQASLNEYMVHIGIGHAPRAVYGKFRYFGKAGRFMEQVTLAHKLHHTVVSDNFGAATLTPEQIVRAEKTLRKLTENLVMERMQAEYPELNTAVIAEKTDYKAEVERIIAATRKGNYGVNGTFAGATSMLVTAAPFYLLNYALYAATGSLEFLISSNISLMFMIVQSVYSHWYLHYKPSPETDSLTSRFQMWYLQNTPFGRLAQRLHFTHHEMPYAYDRTSNGVIMAGSASDRIANLFVPGFIQNPRVKDLVEMYTQGFLPELQSLMTPPGPKD